MNIVVNSQRLAAELRLLNRIVPTKPAIAILSHVLFSTNEDGLHLYATDLEVALSTTCQAQVNESGRVSLPAARFLGLVEQFPDADVTIAFDKGKVAVSCGEFHSKLQAMPVDDFPQLPPVDGPVNTLDVDVLTQLIDRTRYGISATTQKFVLQGAFLTMAGGIAAMVTTDGKRLALATVGHTGADAKMVIPLKALDILHTADGRDVEITVGHQHLQFTYNGRTLTTRTLEGKFPAYERVIPKDNDVLVSVDRGALTAALRRIVLVSEDNRATYITLGNGAITLQSQSQEVGSAVERVKADCAAEMKLCVNGSFMLDFLTTSARQTITLKLKDASTAMLMLDGTVEEDHVGVIMLMKG